ncbi:MAG: acetyl-CoA C-acetyltransferase [Dehalococcoidia bacterium]
MATELKREVVIAGAARTPIGRFGSGLATTPATTLGSVAIRAAAERAGISGADVDYTIMGNCLPAGLGMVPARQSAIDAGIPDSVSALTVNKACASGLSAVVLAAQAIQLDEAEVVAAGGMENMSLAPHLLMNSRTGQRLGDIKMADHMLADGLWCPWENRHMGGSAEAIAGKYEVTRQEQDEFAARSHARAIAAIERGWFKDEIAPVEVKGRRGAVTVVDTDEGPRADSNFEGMAKLRPAFPPGETVTAGNASQISDGAAALVIMSGERAAETGATPIGRIVGYAHAANPPGWLFDAPPMALANLFEKTGESLDDFDLIEVNEAFSAQCVANGKVLGWDWERVNERGGAVALGHPVGASGARILVTLLYGLRRTGGKKGLALICHGGGGAMAMSVEAA